MGGELAAERAQPERAPADRDTPGPDGPVARLPLDHGVVPPAVGTGIRTASSSGRIHRATGTAVLRRETSKPKRTATTVKGREKDELEKAARAGDRDTFRDLAAAMYAKEPAYFVDLLVYKLGKHEDDTPAKRTMWMQDSPDAARDAALTRIHSSDDAGDIAGELDEALDRGEMYVVAHLQAKAPDVVLDEYWRRLTNERRDPAAMAALAGKSVPPLARAVFERAVSRADVEVTRLFAGQLKTMASSDLVALAKRSNARFFIDNLLEPLKADNAIVGILKDHALLAALRASDATAYDAFVARTPQLAVVAEAQKALPTDGSASADQIVDAVFRAFISGQGIDLSYYTNRFDEDRIILSGGTAKDSTDRAPRVDIAKKASGQAPLKPSTQCHNLLAVLRHVMETVPNLKLTVTSEHVEDMLLTTGVGTGLIEPSFRGNVVDDDGTPTGQILFTGNDDGKQSHTWLVINGTPYDPVMGTKGAAVTSSIDAQFTWVPGKVGTVAKEKGGARYLLKKTKTDRDGLRAPANPHGFISAYVLTTDLARHEI